MPNPYKVYQKNQGPGWLQPTLGKYVETPENNNLKIKDAAVTVRNHGGNEKLVKKATLVEGKR